VSDTARVAAALADRYRIERALGAGGMATVYLAHDLKHDREVALKVLRPELAAAIGAERFLAEIHTTAKLQHPNILPLFDSGEADGLLFYVMPYVDGESLRDRLKREKQLPIADAVRIAGEVAAALDYAHRHGVVHRDIKPENLLLHDGRALVADFGIALALSTAGETRLTETGISLGTPYYMSPEQAMGERDITARSDVYALGAVLYEMLVGEPPFTGPTPRAIVARLLSDEPRALASQRKTVPAHVERAVQTALQKLPADRFSTAADFAAALDGRAPGPTARSVSAAAAGTRGAHLPRRWTAIGSGVIVVLAVLALWGWARPVPALPTTREPIILSPLMLQPASLLWGSAIAPDGSAFLYDTTTVPNRAAMLLKERDELRPRYLAAPHHYPGPSFSPDGRFIAFTGDGLEKISRDGGKPVVLSDTAESFSTAWLDNDTIVSIGTAHGRLYSTPAAIGGTTRQILTADSAGSWFAQVSPVPGRDAVLVAVHGPRPKVIALNLASGAVHELIPNAVSAWAVRGILIYAQTNGTLEAVRFDPNRLAVSGTPVVVVDGVQTTGQIVDAMVGRDGSLLYVRGAQRAGTGERLAWVARDGATTLLDTASSRSVASGGLDLSPDGTRVALSLIDPATHHSDVYILDLRNGAQTRLTFEGSSNLEPEWSPDGQRIMYASNAGGGVQMQLWAKRADGTGHAMLVSSDPTSAGLWSHDGKWIVYVTDGRTTGNSDIVGIHTGRDTTHVPLVATPSREFAPALSPDGHWLAYTSLVSGQDKVFVRPFPNVNDGRWQVSEDGAMPQWSHDGTKLFYISYGVTNRLMEVSVKASPTFSAGEPEVLSSVDVAFDFHHPYAVAPDDRHFIMLMSQMKQPSADARVIEMTHWLPEIRAKLNQRS
jgi:Tol biopolymer transport system component